MNKLISAIMGIPGLTAGIILVTTGNSWFSGAGTVGTILIVAGSIGILFALTVFLIVLAALKTNSVKLKRR